MNKLKVLLGLLSAAVLVAWVASFGRKSKAEKLGDKIHEKVDDLVDAVTKGKPSEDLKAAAAKV